MCRYWEIWIFSLSFLFGFCNGYVEKQPGILENGGKRLQRMQIWFLKNYIDMHNANDSNRPMYRLEDRFSHTTDFILEEIETTSLDKEFLAALPKNFKRSTIYRERKNECMDNIGTGHCKYLKRHRACITHTKKMMFYCNKTCRFCVPKKSKCIYTKYGCCQDKVTPAKGFNFAGCYESCIDKHGEAFCKTAKQLSLCSSSNRGVILGCRKSCGLCRPCIDENPAKCRAARLYGLCRKFKNTMVNECRKTCGFCGDKDPCGSVSCPKRKKCIVNRFGDPICICKEVCTKGDHYTGIVCGRDGIEYANLCKLKKSSCDGEPKKVKWYGKCKLEVWAVSPSECLRITDAPMCKLWKRAGACRTWRNRMSKMCPHTCGFCAARSNRSPCFYSKYGCCLDGYTACVGPDYEGCNYNKACTNRYRHLCARFVPACGEKRNKLFMKTNCPLTCYYCKDRHKSTYR